jgi:protein gp37
MTDQTTGISWTNHTWNPFVGCTVHTAGCTNCYAMALAARLERFGQPSYQGTTRETASGKHVWTGTLNRASEAAFRKPLTIREPCMIFVNSMSDFWHENARDAWRLDALGVMAATPHQYQILTKRPENIAPFLDRTRATIPHNAWIGSTVERADVVHRIDTLRKVPARIRFLSIEPLIGPVGRMNLDGISWVIIGGESGPGAREMRAEWVREAIEQCEAQRVPVYFKQWGLARNNPLYERGGAAAVAELDPEEKGGNHVDGRQFKNWPAFEVQPRLL